MEEPKKKSGKTAIIVVLLLLVVAVGGFVYVKRDSLFNKDTGTKTDVVETETPEETPNAPEDTGTKSEFQQYIDNLNPISISAPSKLLFGTKEVIADNLSATQKIDFIASNIAKKETTSDNYAEGYLKESDVKAEVEKVYGPNTYQRTNFNLGCEAYKYNESKGLFVANTGCGGTSGIIEANEIIDTQKTNDKIVIVTAYVFVNLENNKIYKDLALKNEIGPLERKDDEDIVVVLNEYAKANSNNLYHLTYTFESTDGTNYYFKRLTNSGL